MKSDVLFRSDGSTVKLTKQPFREMIDGAPLLYSDVWPVDGTGVSVSA